MYTYESYLKTKNHTSSTIRSYHRQVQIFIKWCELHHHQPSKIDYKNSLEYIKYLSKKNISKSTMHSYLGCVKSYFNYLIATGVREDNPLQTTVVKGLIKKVNHNLLDLETLESFYHQAPSKSPSDKRNKIIIGLMIYQGLATEDIKLLNTEAVDLQKGTIQIPKRKKSNARILELKPWQILELMEYLTSGRSYFFNELQLQNTSKLFAHNKRLAIISYIIKKLKKQHPKLDNYHQIRASVITNWLKKHNLREVQYMAGHRYISSTERYLQEDLENLQNVINQCHPINNG